MSKKHDDGGAAYPTDARLNESREVVQPANYGMTLWDHYYGLAMQGLLANGDGEGMDWADSLSVIAADTADSMIAERNRRIGR